MRPWFRSSGTGDVRTCRGLGPETYEEMAEGLCGSPFLWPLGPYLLESALPAGVPQFLMIELACVAVALRNVVQFLSHRIVIGDRRTVLENEGFAAET